MSIDFIIIKQTFRTLNKLKVKEVILPYKEYDMLRDQAVLHCDDGGSWNYQRRFVDPEQTMSIFGVRVKRELINEF
jgi:hypothetical protein